MKIIGVTGGKGGVGKSTIALLLALTLIRQKKTVVLVDADVECPNDYLLLNSLLGKKIKTIKAFLPKINSQKCTGCGLCVKKCPDHALFQPKDKIPFVLPELCAHCGLCRLVCPVGAIEEEKQTIGFVFKKQLNKNLTLLTGKTNGIVEETGPLVVSLKKVALEKARQLKADFVIIDTAAGLHCSVIQALLGIDQALLVTESTPLGLHDLKLSYDLVNNKLKIPVRAVINQYDLGQIEPIEQFLKSKKIKTALKLAYSKQLVNHYARGKLIDFDTGGIQWNW